MASVTRADDGDDRATDRRLEARQYAALADEHRRDVLAYLRAADEPATVGELAGAIVDAPADADAAEQRRRSVRIELYHRHLPVLDDAALVAFDRSNRTAAIASDEKAIGVDRPIGTENE